MHYHVTCDYFHFWCISAYCITILYYTYAGSPPSPGQPYVIIAQSKSVTIGWPEMCDGGHILKSFTIQYDREIGSYPSRYINDVDPSRRNYTITGLEPSTDYIFKVRSVSFNSRTSRFSSSVSVDTLAPGKYHKM